MMSTFSVVRISRASLTGKSIENILSKLHTPEECAMTI